MEIVTIEIPEQINIKIKADSFFDAILKLKEMEKKEFNTKIKTIKKFKGIAKSDIIIDKEEWYKQFVIL
jgi:hypothetical protein